MKKIYLSVVLFCIFVAGQAQADECSIDTLELTRIKNIKPAVSLDSAVGRLISEVAAFALTKNVPLQVSLVSRAASVVGVDTLNDPLNTDLKAAVEDVVNYINQNVLAPDDLVVRINGSRVVPYGSSSSCYEKEPCYTMPEGGVLPFSGDKIKQSFRKAATFQLIEADRGSLNDDLGMVTTGITGVLFSTLPDPLVINQTSRTQFHLSDDTNVTHGKVEISTDGSYSFDVGSDFNDLGAGEIREVTFGYYYSYSDEDFLAVSSDEQLKTITVTGTGSNVLPVASDGTGATSESDPQPINGTKLLVFAAAEDASVYEITFAVERGNGNLDQIAERIKCDSKQCTDVRENRGADRRSAQNCPAGYKAMDGDGASYRGRLCEAAIPAGCGSNFDPLDDASTLKDGDVIVFKSLIRFNSGDPAPASGISPDGQYLSICNGCAGSSYNTVVASIDPNRSDAQWTVETLDNGKIALRSATGRYLARCFNCVPGISGPNNFAFAHVAEPLDIAQFTITDHAFGLFKLKGDNDRYLSTCFNCVPLQANIPGFQYSVNIVDDVVSRDSLWQVLLKRPNVVTKSTDFIIAQDEVINPSDHWVINPGVVLTVAKGATLTVQNGANLENQGTIINYGTILIGNAGELENHASIVNGSLVDAGIIRVRKGVIYNREGALIDNSDGNHIGNDGSIENDGVIFDPWNRYYGANPKIKPVENGYYLGANGTGEKSCGWLDSPTRIWNPDTNTCTVGNTWLRTNKTLTIASGASLVINGTFTNDGTINNNGSIDNSNALIRQCNTFNGTDPVSLNNFDTVCIKSTQQLLCEEYNGQWDGVNTCENVSGKINNGPVPIAFGEVLTISEGVTWKITGLIENDGEIHIEQGGAVILLGGSITNRETIINAGHISLSMDDSSGIESLIENFFQISNYGTIDNEAGSGAGGYIYGDGGYVDNLCGSVYSVERQPQFVPHNTITDISCPPPPPDSDGDGVEDGLDALPNDANQTSDEDGDGFGDNEFSNPYDLFPKNKLEHADSDGDCGFIPFAEQTTASGNGCGDNSDAFPENSTEQADTDGDCGYAKPDPEALTTSSGNGCGDNSDALPLNEFETLDTDTDGFGDNADLFHLNVEENKDSDGDCGVIDIQTISSGSGCGDNSDPFPYDADNSRTILFANTNEWTPASATFVGVDSIPEPPPAGIELTHGLLDVQLASPSVGTEASFTITYPEPFDADMVWWKYGPTASNNLPHWYMFGGAVFAGNTVTLTIPDGGFGDDDLVVNGSITDPGGPGSLSSDEPVIVPPAGDTQGSKGGSGLVNIWMLLIFFSLNILYVLSQYFRIYKFK